MRSWPGVGQAVESRLRSDYGELSNSISFISSQAKVVRTNATVGLISFWNRCDMCSNGYDDAAKSSVKHILDRVPRFAFRGSFRKPELRAFYAIRGIVTITNRHSQRSKVGDE